MAYRFYRLDIDQAHFGSGSLESSAFSVMADTVFSALCGQALAIEGANGLERLLEEVRGGLAFSDTFPYIGDRIFGPKPIVAVEGQTDGSPQKKLAKKIGYLPLTDLDSWIEGRADLDTIADELDGLGKSALIGKAQIRTEGSDAEPYRVNVVSFAPDAGLWFLAQGGEEALAHVDTLVPALGVSGIGGDRSSGLGRFTSTASEPPAHVTALLQREGTRHMALTTCLPTDAELSDDLLDEATYLLVRRSGFVASQTYAPTPLRKKDLYKFAAGSVFHTRFSGDVVDVSNGGAHPVYSYAKPLWMGLG